MMTKTLERIIRGCGHIEGYGEHPGTGWLLAFIVMGALLGTNGALSGPVMGASVMTLLFGPAYLLGAHERAVASERRRDDFTTNT